MRKLRESIFVLPLVLMVMGGCEKARTGREYGSPVVFGARNADSELTKAAYSGVEYTDGSKTYERIDWVEGDVIRIWSSEASAPDCHYADYTVSEVAESSSRISTAKVSTTGDALAWGEGDHTFYAVYPSPEASGTVTTSLSEAGAVTASVSGSQTSVSCTATDGDYVAVPDLKASMIMTAKTVVDAEDAGKVSLDFYPVTTALEFTITNKTGADLDVAHVEVESASGNINGAFTFTIIDGIPSDCAFSGTSSSDNRTVGMDFSDVSLAVGKTLKFTLFLLPTDSFNDLTFKITDTDGKMRYAALRKADGTPIAFSNHKKTFLNGIFVPEGSVWQMKIGGSNIVSWTAGDVSDVPLSK